MARRNRRGPVGPDHQPGAAAREMCVGNFAGELLVIHLVIVPADALLGHAGGAAGFEDVEGPALDIFSAPRLLAADRAAIRPGNAGKRWRSAKHLTSVAGIPAGFFGPIQPEGRAGFRGKMPLDDFADVGVEFFLGLA